jgi:hypothetical protein
MLRYDSYQPTERETEFVGNLINIKPNDIAYKYFSDINIDLINTRLIEEVKNITFERYNKKIQIEPQQKHILITIMRHVYMRNVKNTRETEVEVELLNREVLKQTVPILISGLLSQIRFIDDYNSIRPFDLPEPTNRKNGNMKPLSSNFDF